MKTEECDNKRKLKSKNEAKQVLRTMGKYHFGSKEHHIYFCNYCHFWHIGENKTHYKNIACKSDYMG